MYIRDGAVDYIAEIPPSARLVNANDFDRAAVAQERISNTTARKWNSSAGMHWIYFDNLLNASALSIADQASRHTDGLFIEQMVPMITAWITSARRRPHHILVRLLFIKLFLMIELRRYRSGNLLTPAIHIVLIYILWFFMPWRSHSSKSNIKMRRRFILRIMGILMILVASLWINRDASEREMGISPLLALQIY